MRYPIWAEWSEKWLGTSIIRPDKSESRFFRYNPLRPPLLSQSVLEERSGISRKVS